MVKQFVGREMNPSDLMKMAENLLKMGKIWGETCQIYGFYVKYERVITGRLDNVIDLSYTG